MWRKSRNKSIHNYRLTTQKMKTKKWSVGRWKWNNEEEGKKYGIRMEYGKTKQVDGWRPRKTTRSRNFAFSSHPACTAYDKTSVSVLELRICWLSTRAWHTTNDNFHLMTYFLGVRHCTVGLMVEYGEQNIALLCSQHLRFGSAGIYYGVGYTLTHTHIRRIYADGTEFVCRLMNIFSST